MPWTASVTSASSLRNASVTSASSLRTWKLEGSHLEVTLVALLIVLIHVQWYKQSANCIVLRGIHQSTFGSSRVLLYSHCIPQEVEADRSINQQVCEGVPKLWTSRWPQTALSTRMHLDHPHLTWYRVLGISFYLTYSVRHKKHAVPEKYAFFQIDGNTWREHISNVFFQALRLCFSI